MRREFVRKVLAEVAPKGAILAVCAGPADAEVLPSATLSDLSTGQDAHDLPYDDRSFDFTFVSDGLHHCSRPHLALTEMYRVARVGVIVVESRDSFSVRVAERLGFAQTFEHEALSGTGGLDNSQIPNHVYRWTEREFEKTLRSYDPTGPISFRYLHALSVPERLGPLRLTERVLTPLVGRQGNSFAMIAYKPTTTWPWLTPEVVATRCG